MPELPWQGVEDLRGSERCSMKAWIYCIRPENPPDKYVP